MHQPNPFIQKDIFDIAPEFTLLSINVIASGAEQLENTNDCSSLKPEDLDDNFLSWGQAHINEWHDVYSKFGTKPKKTPCSVAALRKRFIKTGELPKIDPVVDLYNAISLKYIIPIGGENLDKYQGSPQLVIADGTESFDTIKNGEPIQEHPQKGEVIWRDELGVTCRCWNWRQGVRTRLDASTKNMWFVLERLPTMPLDKLLEAGKELSDGLQALMPNAKITSKLITKDNQL